VSQRVASALEQIPGLQRQLQNDQNTTQDLVRQRLDRIEESARASAKVEILEPQLREAKENASSYFQNAAKYYAKSDGLEKDNQRLEGSLKINTNKLGDVEKKLAAAGEKNELLIKTNSTLDTECATLKTQLDAAMLSVNESAQSVKKLENDKEQLVKSVHDARLEGREDLRKSDQALTDCQTELRDTKADQRRLQNRYDDLEVVRNRLVAQAEEIRTQNGRERLDSWAREKLATRAHEKVLKELSTAKAQLVSLQGQGPEVEAKRQELVQQEEALVTERDRLAEERQDLVSEQEKLAARLHTVGERETSASRREADCLRQEGRLLERDSEIRTRLQDVNARQQALENDRATFALQRKSLDAEVADAKTQVETLTSTIDRLEREMQEVQKKYEASEERRRTQGVVKEGMENRLARTQDELFRAKDSITARDAEVKRQVMKVVSLNATKAKLDKALVQANATALVTLTQATEQIRREATSETHERDQHIQKVYKELISEKQIVADLREKITRLEAEDFARREEQTKLQLSITDLGSEIEKRKNDEIRVANDRKIVQSTLESKIQSLDSSLTSEKQRYKETNQDLETQLDRVHELEQQLKTVLNHLWAVVMKDLWRPEYGFVHFSTLVSWATLRPRADTRADKAFPDLIVPVPESGFQWTLSMCSLEDMRGLYNTTFSQLVARLTLVLPIHNLHQTALPILEAMLHRIEDSELVDLLNLETLLLAVWTNPTYLKSDDRDLCECRIMEVILRGAHFHDTYWAMLKHALGRWKRVTPSDKSMIVRAYNRWLFDIMESLGIRNARITTLPDCISQLAAEYKLTDVRRRIHGVEVEEQLAADDTSSPRALLAGKLFPDISAYFLYDLTKQEAMMFRRETSHYSVDTQTLTLPELFGYHRISGNVTNRGYTIESGGTFETPKPVMIRQALFAARNMPDIFDAAT
jgi:chromosome segregation ATPase